MKIQLILIQILMTSTLAKYWFTKSRPDGNGSEMPRRKQIKPVLIQRYSREPSFLDVFKRKKKGHRRVVTINDRADLTIGKMFELVLR